MKFWLVPVEFPPSNFQAWHTLPWKLRWFQRWHMNWAETRSHYLVEKMGETFCHSFQSQTRQKRQICTWSIPQKSPTLNFQKLFLAHLLRQIETLREVGKTNKLREWKFLRDLPALLSKSSPFVKNWEFSCNKWPRSEQPSCWMARVGPVFVICTLMAFSGKLLWKERRIFEKGGKN